MAEVKTKAVPGTIVQMIEGYLSSRDHLDRSESYRRTIKCHREAIKEQAEDALAAHLTTEDIADDLEPLTPNAAADQLKTWRAICAHGKTKRLLTVDPTLAPRRKAIPKTIGHPAWTDADIERYRARWPVSRQDLCRVGWQRVSRKDGIGRIAYKRMKTSVAADLPILPDLAPELANVPTDRLLFITQDARPIGYKPETLGNWFRDRCAEAKVPGSLHGLRKAGATRLADAGASEWEIASYLAHADTTQAKVYTRKANRSALGDSGFAKLQNMSNRKAALDIKEAKGK